jgi:hypothetical protein
VNREDRAGAKTGSSEKQNDLLRNFARFAVKPVRR